MELVSRLLFAVIDKYFVINIEQCLKWNKMHEIIAKAFLVNIIVF